MNPPEKPVCLLLIHHRSACGGGGDDACVSSSHHHQNCHLHISYVHIPHPHHQVPHSWASCSPLPWAFRSWVSRRMNHRILHSPGFRNSDAHSLASQTFHHSRLHSPPHHNWASFHNQTHTPNWAPHIHSSSQTLTPHSTAMAKMVVFFFLFSLISSPAFSRTLPVSSKTALLDVTSTTQKTLDVFSLDSQAFTSFQNQQNYFPSSSSLTLQLHSRVSVHRVSQRDYQSLTLARLGRDSGRVKALQTRLDLAVHGISKADLTPLETQLEVEALEGPVISGTSQGSGEYFSRIGIGRPPSNVYMVLDTGSDVNWVQCAPCADCYQQADPIFEPTKSASFEPLTCSTKQCSNLDVSECRNGSCLYEVSYGDGSYTVGDFVTETITFGGSASVSKIAIGCGHNNEGLFVGAAGLIGLGGGPLSFPSQINATSFSYCLVDRDSVASSTLEFDSVTPSDAVTAPLLHNPKLDTFYYVDLTGLSVSGDLLPIPSSVFKLADNGDGGVIVDSGTAVTRLQTEAYNALRDAFVKGTKHLPSTNSVALFDTCFNLSSLKSVEVPSVAFHFSNGKELALPAKNYLIPVDSSGTYCFAFAPTSSSLSIIGNVQQQGTRVSFNLRKSLVGFSPNKC